MVPRRRSIAVLVLALLPAFNGSARAQWIPGGTPIWASALQLFISGAASDLDGGAYVVWGEWRHPGVPDVGIFALRVRADGTLDPLDPPGGFALCTAAGSRSPSGVISDWQGGAYVAWTDFRDPPPDSSRIYGVYLTRFGPGGRAPGWIADGTPLCSGPCTPYGVPIAPDTYGGVFVAWRAVSPPVIRLARMDADGRRTPGWPAAGAEIRDSLSFLRDLVPDGGGGAYVGTERFLYHVGADGATAPGWPAQGLDVTQSDSVSETRTIADDSGGVYCIWTKPDPPNDGVYAQRILSDGTTAPGWPASGLQLSAHTSPLSRLGALVTGGRLLAIWARWDWVTIPQRVLAQMATPAGALAPGWPPDGADVGPVWGYLPDILRAAPDGGGGAFVTWGGFVASQPFVTQHVRADGSIATGWPAEGMLLPLPDHVGVGPAITTSAGGTAFVAWTDLGPVGSFALTMPSLRVARVADSGPLLTSIVALDRAARPDRVRITWRISPWSDIPLVVQRRERFGWVAVDTLRADLFGRISYTDTQVRPGSTYEYRISFRAGGAEYDFAETAVEVPLLTLRVNAAPVNPARGSIAAEAELPTTGPASIELYDVRGRLVELRGISGGVPRIERIPLDASRMASGVYFLRLRQGASSVSKRVVFIR